MSPTLCRIVAVAVLLCAATDGTAALSCIVCTNNNTLDNCASIETDYADEHKHETCEEIEGMKSYCFREHIRVCQSYVYKNAAAQVGYGGGGLKLWKRLGCTHVNDTDPIHPNHMDCYWKRTRSGRDVEHKKSGMKVVARSSIKVFCHCDTDLCNTDDGVIPCWCGPKCWQASRDECETPGYKPKAPGELEPFSKDCHCPNEILPLTDAVARLWPDCGSDPNLWRPESVGRDTHRSMKAGAVGVYSEGGCAVAIAVLVVSAVRMLC